MSRLFKLGATVAMGAGEGSPFPLLTDDYIQSAQLLKELGYDTMEVHIRAPELVDGPKIKAFCESIGVGISTLGTGQAYSADGLSLTSADSGIREAAIERIKAQMELGVTLGCPVIIGSVRGNIEEGESFESTHARMISSMKYLAGHAEAIGAEMVVEAIDRFETNYLHTAEDVLELIDRVGSSRVKVHLDTFHMNLEERCWRTAILSCKGRLGHVHLADNNRNYPGWGLIDFKSILTYLREIDYDRSLTIECFPSPDGVTALKRARKYLDELMCAMA